MDRRTFNAALGSAAVLAASGLATWPAFAQRMFTAGKEYRVLDKPVAVEAPAGKIEVVEFFWYSCPHCNAFEPQLVDWSKKLPPDVVLKRVPVKFNDTFVPQQRLYYALEAMGKLDTVHNKVFHAIHSERQKLETEDQIAAWVEKQGVDRAKFLEHFKSFSVSTKAGRAAKLADEYRIEGVPTLGVAGRWWTDASSAGSMQRALQVTEFLIAEARAKK